MPVTTKKAAQPKAAPKTATAHPAEKSSAAGAEQKKAAGPKAAQAAAHPAGAEDRYTVVRGDTLSGIAADHAVKGGWPQLYAANRAVVGDDPDLILPGQRLALDPTGAAGTATRPAPQPKAQPKAHPKAQPKAAPKAAPKAHPKAAPQPKPAARPERKKSAAEPAGRTATEHAPAHTSGFTLPVHAAIGTGYHTSGGSWASGYHTGVDFLVGTGTAVHSVAAGHGRDGRVGRVVRLPGRHPARRRPLQPVRPPVADLREGRASTSTRASG